MPSLDIALTLVQGLGGCRLYHCSQRHFYYFTNLPEIGKALPEIETALSEKETALPEIETTLLEIETALPEIQTALPEIGTALPEIEIALPEIETALLEIEIVSEVESRFAAGRSLHLSHPSVRLSCLSRPSVMSVCRVLLSTPSSPTIEVQKIKKATGAEFP